MEEDLILAVIYQGVDLELPVRVYPYGYTYRLEVGAGEELVVFEPDEEGSYRAFANEKTDRVLLSAIALQLQKLK